ncbi:hypothetical protein B0H19DRAFT_1008166, partial [Mycena capillaripes]
MAMPYQHDLAIYGGTGGDGGQSVEKGGTGGAGYGPNVNAGPGTMHVHYHGEAEKREIILNWLSPINFFLRQADISRVRAKGTGGWLLADPVFKKWESGSGSTLWCRGIPGAGKTILASMVVDHLTATCKSNRDIGVTCMYLNHKEADIQTPSKLLAALWRQLVLDRDTGTIAEDLYKQHQGKGTAPTLEEVVKVLSSSLAEFSKVFIIVDAIDEYPETQRWTLLQHMTAMGSNVNLMITSRPHIFPEVFSFPTLETLDIQAASTDIREYINVQIYSSPRLFKHVQNQSNLRDEIHAKIIATVDGMFLLAKLHIESLSTKLSIGAVREALNELPKDLHDSYDSAMQRIEYQQHEDRQIAHTALIWIANAKRPLKVPEIRAALAIKPGAHRLNNDYLMDIETILSVCAG